MDKLDVIRKKKMEQMQQQAQNQMSEQQYLQAQIDQLEVLVKKIMSREALQRYGTLKTAHPERAIQSLVIMSQLLQQGKLQEIDDETFKEILKQIPAGEKNFNIKRK